MALVAVSATLHQLRFLPTVFFAGEIAVEGHKLQKTSHAGNVTKVVSPIRPEPTAHCEQFKRQFRKRHSVSFWRQNLRQELFQLYSRLFMSYICRRDDECMSFSIPGEHRLTLRARNGDDYQRFCFRQIIGDSEVKKCQALLTEFFIQQTLRVASFDFLF